MPTESVLPALLSALTAGGASTLPILDLVLSSIADGVAITDESASMLYLNAAARRILGVAPDAPVDIRTHGADLYYLHDFSPIPAGELPLVLALQGEESKDVELFARSAALPEGALICLNARPLRHPDGRVAGGVAVFHDAGARKRAEDELHAANGKLGAWVAELERRATVALLVNEMADLLQSCRSTKEFYQVVSTFAAPVFDRESGAMFVVNASRSAIELVASWGGPPPAERVFAPDACWALRRGRVHRAGGDTLGPDCEHASSAGTPGYRCIPMMGQGEALGVLHVRTHPEEPGSVSELSSSAASARAGTVVTVAELP